MTVAALSYEGIDTVEAMALLETFRKLDPDVILGFKGLCVERRTGDEFDAGYVSCVADLGSPWFSLEQEVGAWKIVESTPWVWQFVIEVPAGIRVINERRF